MDTGSIADGDHWLANTIPSILGSYAFTQQNSVLFIVWDEDDYSGNNQVPCIVVSPLVQPGFQSFVQYSHYSLLSTIEQAWGLPPLTSNDRGAVPMSDFFAPLESPASLPATAHRG
jgi:hypothetical protein